MSPLKLTARIDSMGNSSYLAYIDSIKGMVEESSTPEDAMNELLISLKVKIAYDLGIELDGLKEKVVVPLQQYTIELQDLEEKGYVETEIDLPSLVG